LQPLSSSSTPSANEVLVYAAEFGFVLLDLPLEVFHAPVDRFFMRRSGFVGGKLLAEDIQGHLGGFVSGTVVFVDQGHARIRDAVVIPFEFCQLLARIVS